MSLTFLHRDESGFADAWRRVAETGAASWRYLPRYTAQQELCAAGTLAENLSFVALEGENPAAICPLLLERLEGVALLGYRGGYNAAPVLDPSLSARKHRSVRHACFARIDELAATHGAGKAMVLIDPLVSPPEHNVLTEFPSPSLLRAGDSP